VVSVFVLFRDTILQIPEWVGDRACCQRASSGSAGLCSQHTSRSSRCIPKAFECTAPCLGPVTMAQMGLASSELLIASSATLFWLDYNLLAPIPSPTLMAHSCPANQPHQGSDWASNTQHTCKALHHSVPFTFCSSPFNITRHRPYRRKSLHGHPVAVPESDGASVTSLN
jgi:hypothetical protein